MRSCALTLKLLSPSGTHSNRIRAVGASGRASPGDTRHPGIRARPFAGTPFVSFCAKNCLFLSFSSFGAQKEKARNRKNVRSPATSPGGVPRSAECAAENGRERRRRGAAAPGLPSSSSPLFSRRRHFGTKPRRRTRLKKARRRSDAGPDRPGGLSHQGRRVPAMIPPHKNAQPAPFWAPKLDPKWSTSPPSPLSSRPPPPPRKGDGREFQNKAPKPPNPAVTPTCSGGRGPGAGMRHASGRLRASGPLNPGAKPVARGGATGCSLAGSCFSSSLSSFLLLLLLLCVSLRFGADVGGGGERRHLALFPRSSGGGSSPATAMTRWAAAIWTVGKTRTINVHNSVY